MKRPTKGDCIALAALEQVGTPFRLHGRVPGVALDCIGLAEVALNGGGVTLTVPDDYSIRGTYAARLLAFFAQNGFERVDENETEAQGDIAIAQPSPLQFHLMIFANDGWVHAHAGLDRVVFLKGKPCWPLLAIWRHCGD